MHTKRFPFKVMSCSPNRTVHEAKKSWLESQGIKFGQYSIENLPFGYDAVKYPSGLNYYWHFQTADQATTFALKWGMR